MTTVGTRTVRCRLCGTPSSRTEITSSNEFDPRDLDGRPAEMLRSTIWAWIHECPGCRRCARDLESDEPTGRDVVDGEAYRRQIDDTSCPELARRFLCRALLDEAAGRLAEAATALLHAAWAADDASADAVAARCRSRAADLWRA